MHAARIRTALMGIALAVATGFIAAQPSTSDARLKAEITDTQKYLVKAWTAVLGSRFTPPTIVYYSSPMQTGCGQVDLGNAFYCSADNRIYIDPGFIAQVDKLASEKLKSPGDYAGLAVVAHEFGHAVENYGSLPAFGATEGGADCFAGAAFGFAIADGQFPDYGFEEALSFMELGGDDKILGYNADNPEQALLAWVLYHHPNHGDVIQRQAAFLRGFYDGPRFCGDGWTPGAPPRGRSLVASQSLFPSHFLATSNHNCAVSTTAAGTRVRKDRGPGNCTINLLPAATLLPEHVRIEVSVKLLSKPVASHPIAGIYYGDNRSTSSLTRFAYGLEDPNDAEVTNIDGEPRVEEPALKGGFLGAIPQPAGGEQHLTLDIHHEGKNVYFIEYLNGVPVYHNGLWRHGTKYRRLNVAAFGNAPDEAGLWVGEPGVDVLFSNFRVMGLYR